MEDHINGAITERVGTLIPLMDMHNVKRSEIIGKINLRLKFRIVKLRISSQFFPRVMVRTLSYLEGSRVRRGVLVGFC